MRASVHIMKTPSKLDDLARLREAKFESRPPPPKSSAELKALVAEVVPSPVAKPDPMPVPQAVPTPKPPPEKKVKAPKSKAPAKVARVKSREGKRVVTVYLTPELFTKLKVFAAKSDRKVEAVVISAIKAMLA